MLHNGGLDGLPDKQKPEESPLEAKADEGEGSHVCRHKKSASDCTAQCISEPLVAPARQRSCSAVDIKTAYMQAKIDTKIKTLEKELNINLSRTKERKDVNKCQDLNIQNYFNICRSRSFSFDGIREIALNRLQEELIKVQKELKLKDEEVVKLSKIRDEVGSELEDLTASLFEEANKMVHDANVKRVKAERTSREANMKVEMLEAEVEALKSLVKKYQPEEQTIPKPPLKFEGVKNLFRPKPPPAPPPEVSVHCPSVADSLVDPVYNHNFVEWRQKPEIVKEHPFLSNIYQEEILPCLNFRNKELSEKVLEAIEKFDVVMEAASQKKPYPKHCTLLDRPRLCTYRLRLFGDDSPTYTISTICRNRIAAVCEFFHYLRYIQQGLIKSSIHELYWGIIEKRKNMCLARLGLYSP